MPEAIDIRRERPDHPQVAALLDSLDSYLASLYEPEANHILGVAELLASEVTFLAAWAGDEVLGCGAVRVMPGEAGTQGRHYGEIKRMYVSPQRRGERIAERLLGALEQSLIDQGIGLALLETGEAQREAIRLYERCGYLRRSSFNDYPANGLSVFYAKVLVDDERFQVADVASH